VRWVRDRTGRFPQRPHYNPEEIDSECGQLICAFLQKKYGKIEFPIRTEDLTILIEEKADLDSFADLSGEEGEVEGVTEFVRGKRPLVRIANRLSERNMENRLRTTLTHEFGHVHFHRFMFDVETRSGSLFPTELMGHTNKCNRGTIVDAPETDWMEWQAGYVCGAILMPSDALIATVQAFRKDNALALKNLGADSGPGQELIGLVAAAFQTSIDAARVRLLKKRILAQSASGTSELF